MEVELAKLRQEKLSGQQNQTALETMRSERDAKEAELNGQLKNQFQGNLQYMQQKEMYGLLRATDSTMYSPEQHSHHARLLDSIFTSQSPAPALALQCNKEEREREREKERKTEREREIEK
jgi:hypothetical protein